MTSAVSLLPEGVAYIGAGTYTDITRIVAPDSAAQGERVDVTVKVKNIDTYWDHVIACVAIVNGLRFIDEVQLIRSGETNSYSGAFLMAGGDVTIYAYTYYPEDAEWIPDDATQVDIKLEEVVGWQLLDSRTVAVKSSPPPVVGWQLLDSRTVAVRSAPPPVVGWQLLDSRTIAVRSAPPPVVGWQLLDEKTVGLAAGLPAVVWELVYHHEYPQGKTYVGKAEECTATLTIPLPEQLFPNKWLIEKIADTFADEVAKEGGEMLDIKIYEDATPMWHTDYKIVATAITSPFPWALVIPLVLAIILVVAFISLVVTFKDIDWGEIPAPIPWAILALAGGLAVAGAGVAFALSRPKPKE